MCRHLFVVTGVRRRFSVLCEPSDVRDLQTYPVFRALRAGRLSAASCAAVEPWRRLHACQGGCWRREALVS